MGIIDMEHEVYECQQCGHVSFSNSTSTSLDEDRTSVEVTPVEHPELAVVLREVFGISKTGLSVCISLMEQGESTTGEIAKNLDIDRSTVSRQLNHLTDIGLLEKHQRLLKDGGYVHVYSPVNEEEVHRRLTIGLYAWVGEAVELVEDINREKVKALAQADENGVEQSTDIYWDR